MAITILEHGTMLIINNQLAIFLLNKDLPTRSEIHACEDSRDFFFYCTRSVPESIRHGED